VCYEHISIIFDAGYTSALPLMIMFIIYSSSKSAYNNSNCNIFQLCFYKIMVICTSQPHDLTVSVAGIFRQFTMVNQVHFFMYV
jgi:hypothetical protein